MLFYILIFIIGLIIGSFLNVVIYRLPENKSIIVPPSHCPKCETRLKPFDLVPILSFLFYKGKCRYCGVKISWQYPFVELLTAVLLLSLYKQFGLNTQFIVFSFLIFILIVCSSIDIKYKIIPNKITYSAIIIFLILSIIFNHISFISSLLGILIPGGLLFIIAFIYGKGLGMGDVKLVAVIGAVIGWEYTIIGIFIGSLIGSIIGLTLILTAVIDRKTRIAFGPYISIGTIIGILFGQKLLGFYLNLF